MAEAQHALDASVTAIITDALSGMVSGEQALGRIGAAAIELLADVPPSMREDHLSEFLETIEIAVRASWEISRRG